MKAWAYNNLVKEYKRRIAMNKTIAESLKDKTFTGYYRESAEKKFRTNAAVAADLLAEIRSVRKEDLVY